MNEIKPVIASQYRASLAMLREAIEKCTDALWTDARHTPPFWRIAYHTLFFTDLYLSRKGKRFTPWPRHIDKVQSLDPLVPIDVPPYSRTELLDYASQIAEKVESKVNQLDLGAPSGFGWLPFTKLELQFYNIRHVHHHAGQLSIWLREEAGEEIQWIGTA